MPRTPAIPFDLSFCSTSPTQIKPPIRLLKNFRCANCWVFWVLRFGFRVRARVCVRDPNWCLGVWPPHRRISRCSADCTRRWLHDNPLFGNWGSDKANYLTLSSVKLLSQTDVICSEIPTSLKWVKWVKICNPSQPTICCWEAIAALETRAHHCTQVTSFYFYFLLIHPHWIVVNIWFPRRHLKK